MRRRTEFVFDRSPRILMVESDELSARTAGAWIEGQQAKLVWVKSAKEAMDLLYDMVFIESSFDGLLAEQRSPDMNGRRVVEEFRHEFPGMATALMTASDDVGLDLWASARRIAILRKPLEKESIAGWLEQFKVPA